MSLRATLAKLERQLHDLGVAMSALEARYILCEAAQISQTELTLHAERPLSADAQQRLADLMARRLRGEPLNRVLGHAEFWGLPLTVTPAVLDPRNDTETLVRAALALLSTRKNEPLKILDLGTGSGALLCALLHECPAAYGIGIDLSKPAARIAAENLARNGLSSRGHIVVSRWGAALNGRFDLILSNPPYIEHEALAGLETAVRDYDPPLALDGGPDGFVAYRALMADIPRLLKPQGWAILEAGAGQAAGIAELFRAHGFATIRAYKDYGGHERAIATQFAGASV